MKISYRWLSQYIDLPEPPEKIAEILTSTGLEVESVTPFETVAGGLRGVVIGEVLSCARHPNADKLTLATVDVGAGAPYPIVCGAPNVAPGQKVAVALPGTTLHPFGGEPFTIKEARIRGEASRGMICAEDELGLGPGHEGILVLQTKAPNGSPAAGYFNIESDFVFEIGLTPNRADAASHIGVARDLHAKTGRALRWPPVNAFTVGDTSLSIPVRVENTSACPRYSAVTITGIRVAESPDWLKTRLRSIGLSPINNVVDITNFVCHELGQPLHAFDAKKITGKEVIVSTQPEGTKFTTLDGKERKLGADDLMICNAKEGMCMAGIFGGLGSGIAEQTTSLFLESACFSPEYIRRSTLRHGLKTDASFRFERGSDPNITVYALKRAALLIAELAGGRVSSELIDVYPEKIAHRVFRVKDRNLLRLIGKEMNREEMTGILDRLEIKVTAQDAEGFTVSVPPYRVDVQQEADIVEEILRIHGFDQVPLNRYAQTDYIAEHPVLDPNRARQAVSEVLAAGGFFEIFTNSLTRASYAGETGTTFTGEPVQILNKLSEEQAVMRQTLLFSGLEALAYNLNRKQRDLRLFEFGKVYWREAEKGESLDAHREEERIALFLTGQVPSESWHSGAHPAGFYDLREQVHKIFLRCHVEGAREEPTSGNGFDYGMTFRLGKKTLGQAGKLSAQVVRRFGIRQDVFYADFSWRLLFKSANPKFVIKDVAPFPEVRRDLSLVIDRTVTFKELVDLARQTEKRLVKDINAFDVYEGEKIPEGRKAYALAFTLQDETKTLTDAEIDQVMDKLMAAYEKKIGAVIRK
jgi:phenylalanyl-tRNA synthetase beta chain